MAGEVGVAVIGCGYWGMNYVRIFSELPLSRVVVACDQRASRLSEVERRFPGVAVATDLSQALEMRGVDAVVICTGAASHYAVARACLAAGKQVLVEKPMTTCVADAVSLVEEAAERQRLLMVGHTFLYNSGVRKVKDYIQRRKIGQIYYMYARRTNLGPIRRDVNALWDLAPHDISIFNYLLDSTPTWASAVGARVLGNCREDVGFVSLGYAGGVVGHIHVSWADPTKVREIVVVGSDERIVFDDINTVERVRIYEKGIAPSAAEAASYGEYGLLIRDGDIISPRIEVTEPLKNECQHFLECVAQGCRPLTSGQSGIEIVRVMEAIDRSMALNGAPIDLPSTLVAA